MKSPVNKTRMKFDSHTPRIQLWYVYLQLQLPYMDTYWTHNKKVGTAWLSRLETAPPNGFRSKKKTPLGDTSGGVGALEVALIISSKKKKTTCTIARESFFYSSFERMHNLFLETTKIHISPKTYTIHVVNKCK